MREERRVKRAALLLLCVIVATISFAQEQGPEETALPEEAQLQAWTKQFQEAENVFNSADQSSSIAMFQTLIDQISAEKEKRTLTDAEKSLLLRAIDYVGQAYFLEGEQEQSKAAFLKMIQIDPNYRMNDQLVSSKIIELVSRIKSENLALISISSSPPGATVKLDGAVVGTTDLSSVYSFKGPHEIEVTKAGYFPLTKTVTAVAGRTERVSFTLERSSSVAYFITYPKDVELWMGGKRLGTTTGEPSERAQKAATEQNLPITDFSAEFPIPDLQPGVYEVEFRKPCWETAPRKITIDKNDDYLYAPIVMEPSHATLNITADDPQANVFLDNEYKGIAPKQNLDICSGKHSIKLKGPLGKFQQQIDIKKGQALTINAKLNPAVAFLGMIASPDVSKGELDQYRDEAVRQLAGLKKLNFQDNSQGSDQAVQEDALRQITGSLLDGRPDAARKAKIQELCNRVESDLLLFGLVTGNAQDRWGQFYLLSNWSSMADLRKMKIGDTAQWNLFRQQLDFDYPLFEKRLGVQLIDTVITKAPVVSRVGLKTFEEGLAVGDIITAVEATPVKSAADVFNATRTAQGAEQITVKMQHAGAEITVPVRMIKSPMEIEPYNPNLLYNRQIVAFKKAGGLPSATALEKSIASLNIALCYYQFREYNEALNELLQVKLDRQTGIGPGTVNYHIAQCYVQLGRIPEAAKSLAEAARATQNTLGSDDGLPLPPQVERLQKALE